MRFLHDLMDSFFAWLDGIRERHILPFMSNKEEGDKR